MAEEVGSEPTCHLRDNLSKGFEGNASKIIFRIFVSKPVSIDLLKLAF